MLASDREDVDSDEFQEENFTDSDLNMYVIECAEGVILIKNMSGK